MSYLNTRDGTRIFYKDWGSGRPVVLSHAWPLNADAWDAQMAFLVRNGFRVIAFDRRGHGRSDQPAHGNDIDTYADDLADLLSTLDVRDATLVGHSIGGGEIARYVSRHGSDRIAKMILIGAVAPSTAGVPMEIFDGIRKALAGNRGQFFKDVAGTFLGANRPNASVPQGTIDAFWFQGMTGGILGQIDCIRAFSEVDYTEDMKRISVPTLILHGDDDQNVPIEISARQSVKLIPNATLKVYPGGSHGIVMTHADEINADILGVLRS